MREYSYFSFLHMIENGADPAPVYLVYGYNEFLGERIIKMLIRRFLGEQNDFNYRRYYFDAEESENWFDIISEVKSSNFFVESRKVIAVVIRKEKFLSITREEAELIQNYQTTPNLNSILVIYLSLDLMKDEYKQLRKNRIGKFIQYFEFGSTVLIDLDKIREADVREYIRKELKKKNISITQDALERMIEMKGSDFPTIIHQLQKFEIAQISEKKVDTQDVEEIISGIDSHSIWDLTEAIEEENPQKYLKVLNYHFLNGIKPAFIIGTLITHYNKIYTAKFLLKQNIPPEEIGRKLNQPSFFLKRFIDSVRRFSDKRIREILDVIYSLDFDSKTSGESLAKLSLQNFIFKLMLLRNR